MCITELRIVVMLDIKIYKTLILPVVLYGCETVSYIKGGMQAKGI